MAIAVPVGPPAPGSLRPADAPGRTRCAGIGKNGRLPVQHASADQGTAMATRIEIDSMGELEVDAQRLWGAQTQRSLLHFRISGERMPQELLAALARIKQACAGVNHELGLLDEAK